MHVTLSTCLLSTLYYYIVGLCICNIYVACLHDPAKNVFIKSSKIDIGQYRAANKLIKLSKEAAV